MIALEQLITARLGLAFDERRRDELAAAVTGRSASRKAGSPAEYLRILQQPGSGDVELAELAALLTVGETFFFRQNEHFDALVALLTAPGTGDRTWRILSAGCATGEEPYTVALRLAEHPSVLQRTSIQGIDIHAGSLERARRGRYTAWALRATPPEAAQRWFEKTGTHFDLHADIRRCVRFEQRNLADPDAAFWSPGAFDVVLLRNVAMYFTPEAARALIARVAGALTPGGYLFLGHAETLRGVSMAFHLVHTHGAFYYRRRDPDDDLDSVASAHVETPPARWLPVPVTPSTPAEPEPGLSWIEAIEAASARVASLTAVPRAPVPGPPPGRVAPAVLRPARTQTLAGIVELLQVERFEDALARLRSLPADRQNEPDALLLRAVALTNQGDVTAARGCCDALLAHDEFDGNAHYLLALGHEHQGDLAAAAEADRVAIYLDPDSAMPHLHLGRLLRRSGDRAGARRELAQAAARLPAEEPGRLLLLGGGFSRAALVRLCEAELAACGGTP